MQLGTIMTGNVSPDDDITLNQFLASREAETDGGKRFLALLDEKVWSGAYTASIHFDDKGRLVLFQVNHPCFIEGRALWIDPEKQKTVRDVETAVRAHIDALRKHLEPKIARLQIQDDKLYRARRQILIDRAKAAVVAIFPEAESAEYFKLQDDSAFYSFGAPDGEQTIFVVREVGGEFIGRVVRIILFPLEWRCLRPGLETNQREWVFWTALAKTFASTKLGIPENEFHCLDVVAKKKTFEEMARNPGIDPYIVEGVHLRTASQKIVVEFDCNMPVDVSAVPAVV